MEGWCAHLRSSHAGAHELRGRKFPPREGMRDHLEASPAGGTACSEFISLAESQAVAQPGDGALPLWRGRATYLHRRLFLGRLGPLGDGQVVEHLVRVGRSRGLGEGRVASSSVWLGPEIRVQVAIYAPARRPARPRGRAACRSSARVVIVWRAAQVGGLKSACSAGHGCWQHRLVGLPLAEQVRLVAQARLAPQLSWRG